MVQKANIVEVFAAGPITRIELRRLGSDEIIEARLPHGAVAPQLGTEEALGFRQLRVFPAAAA